MQGQRVRLTISLLGIVIALIVAYVVYKKIKRLVEAKEKIAETRSEEQVYGMMGMKRSYSNSWYEKAAQMLGKAMIFDVYNPFVYWGKKCDAPSAIKIFKYLKNDRDFNALLGAFGTKDGYTMTQWVAVCLSPSERIGVNNYFKSVGMTKRLA